MTKSFIFTFALVKKVNRIGIVVDHSSSSKPIQYTSKKWNVHIKEMNDTYLNNNNNNNRVIGCIIVIVKQFKQIKSVI